MLGMMVTSAFAKIDPKSCFLLSKTTIMAPASQRSSLLGLLGRACC